MAGSNCHSSIRRGAGPSSTRLGSSWIARRAFSSTSSRTSLAAARYPVSVFPQPLGPSITTAPTASSRPAKEEDRASLPRPKTESIPLRIVHMSPRAHEAGVENHDIEGIPVRVYSPAKTVADCFKFRNKIGLDIALEAMRDYRRSADYDSDLLWHYAEICRVTRVMLPYLEATV